MAFSERYEDRVAIGALIASYGDAISIRDFTRIVALWSEDGVWTHPVLDAPVGKTAILATITRLLEFVPTIYFTSHLGHLVIEGDTAEGRCWTTEAVVEANGTTYNVYGLYEDQYVRYEESWLFQRRNYRLWTITDKYGSRSSFT